VKPFFDATHNAIQFQTLATRGQRQIIESDIGARSVFYDRLFYSRKCGKRAPRVQLDLFGKPIEDAGKKKKKKKKRVKKKAFRAKPLF
jgi:hypothetical protein